MAYMEYGNGVKVKDLVRMQVVKMSYSRGAYYANKMDGA